MLLSAVCSDTRFYRPPFPASSTRADCKLRSESPRSGVNTRNPLLSRSTHLTIWPFDRTFRCLSPMFYQALIRIKMSNKCSDHGNNYYRYKDMFTPYQYICLFICTDLFKCVSFKAHSSTMRSKFSIILPYVDCVDCVGCVVGVRSFYAL